MTATAKPAASEAETSRPAKGEPKAPPVLGLGEGVELLGSVHGCGYRDGASLVRRRDGQIVQLGQLMYGLLECIDGRRNLAQLADALSEKLGRKVGQTHVVRLAQKLAQQGLLAGSEHRTPPRRNPLLALRFKVLVSNPKWTRRLTAPFGLLFRPWVMWPVIAAFAAVFWFVLIHKGVAGATAQAFHRPGLLLLVFALAVISAGFHELGHAAACRYGGATPGGMGMGLYLVWPAFYTDVTDAYRLPKRSRLRIDLAGLYFNAMVAVATMAVWLVWRMDALLLLVALQVLQMVKQLSPVIRADGYHILSDATGVPDMYAHIGPTMRRLLPGHRNEPSALSGRARLIVTLWVLVIVPVLLGLMLGAILMLPRIATTAWDSGRHLILAIPHQAGHGQVLDVLASLLQLVALALPVLGSALITQKVARMVIGKGRSWSRGHPARGMLVSVAGAGVIALMVWAWWPSGQYQPVRASEHGTLVNLFNTDVSPAAEARPVATAGLLSPGTHLAVSMIPVGGASRSHPALFLIERGKGEAPVAIISDGTPKLTGSPGAAIGSGTTTPSLTSTTTTPGSTTTTGPAPTSTTAGGTSTTAAGAPPAGKTNPVPGKAFPFRFTSHIGGKDNSARAVGTSDHGVTYDVAYSLVTVTNGAPVTERNSAVAEADCNACTTVAVSFQLVLVVGQSNVVAPLNTATALNRNCPACTTTALADQIVVTLKSKPSKALLAELQHALAQLNALSELGANGTPQAVAAQVAAIQREIDSELAQSGLLANPPNSSSTSGSSGSQTTTSSSGTSTTQSPSDSSTTGTQTTPASDQTSTSASPTSPTTTTGATTTTTTPTPTDTTSTSPATTTTPTTSTTSSPEG